MNDVATWAIIISAATLLLNVIIQIRSGSWNMADKLSLLEKGLRKAIEDARADIESKADLNQSRYGEGLAAIRQRMHETEMTVQRTFTTMHETFARRDSVHTMGGRLEQQIVNLDEKTTEQFNRVNDKLDKWHAERMGK